MAIYLPYYFSFLYIHCLAGNMVFCLEAFTQVPKAEKMPLLSEEDRRGKATGRGRVFRLDFCFLISSSPNLCNSNRTTSYAELLPVRIIFFHRLLLSM